MLFRAHGFQELFQRLRELVDLQHEAELFAFRGLGGGGGLGGFGGGWVGGFGGGGGVVCGGFWGVWGVLCVPGLVGQTTSGFSVFACLDQSFGWYISRAGLGMELKMGVSRIYVLDLA